MRKPKAAPILYPSNPSQNSVPENPQKLAVINLIFQAGKYPLLHNRLTVFWPFTIATCSESDRKFLKFKLPNRALPFTFLGTALSICYFLNYTNSKFLIGTQSFSKLDTICNIIWDLMIIGSDIANRIYGIVKLSKFKSFWFELVDIVEQFFQLVPKEDIDVKFKQLNRWGLKWTLSFALLGITLFSTGIYFFAFAVQETPLNMLITAYLFFVLVVSPGRVFLVIFFLKIITFGFTICKIALDSLPNKANNVDIMDYLKSQKNTNKNEFPSNNTSTKLDTILKLVASLEVSVKHLNSLFIVILFGDTVYSFVQILFSMYFLHVESEGKDATYYGCMAIQVVVSSISLICLCTAATQLTVECDEMVGKFQDLSPETFSTNYYKVPLIVTRLTSDPPRIKVSNLFVIQESLLGAALHTIATYLVVLIQMRVAYK
ncbi:unnamed protein product [Orchesella dallaii]|uniref:Gustatory receptor n=1 Tax=Orchesella dallaii TaxID=48710 RepID=A0ABP1PWN3_9HEXA